MYPFPALQQPHNAVWIIDELSVSVHPQTTAMGSLCDILQHYGWRVQLHRSSYACKFDCIECCKQWRLWTLWRQLKYSAVYGPVVIILQFVCICFFFLSILHVTIYTSLCFCILVFFVRFGFLWVKYLTLSHSISSTQLKLYGRCFGAEAPTGLTPKLWESRYQVHCDVLSLVLGAKICNGSFRSWSP